MIFRVTKSSVESGVHVKICFNEFNMYLFTCLLSFIKVNISSHYVFRKHRKKAFECKLYKIWYPESFSRDLQIIIKNSKNCGKVPFMDMKLI